MRINLLKTMLVGIGLLAGTTCALDASAQNKRTLASQDYESATAADWTCPNGKITFVTGDATYGNYVQLDQNSGNGSRSAYKTVTYSQTPDGYTSTDMDTQGYVVEFDAALKPGNNAKTAQFAVLTADPSLKDNTDYSGTDYIFALSQSTAYSTTWYINDLTNATTNTVRLTSAVWYHYKLVVTLTGVSYTISSGETETASGTLEKEYTTLPQVERFFAMLQRYNGQLLFDNLDIYDYTASAVANDPTIALTKVNGTERTYTISFTEGETLYYKLPSDDDFTAVTSGTSTTVTTSTSGTLTAYTTNGTAKSNEITATVIAEEITLNAPTYALTGLGEGYTKEYTITSDNSSVLLSPTATLSYVFTPAGGTAQDAVTMTGTTLSATEEGTYVVTASAEGYTSSSITIDNSVYYVLTNEYDFSALTADDFSTDLWTAGTENNEKWGWNAIAKYELTDATTNASTAFDGITLFSDQTPTIYIGYGLMYPYNNSKNYGSISLTNTSDDEYAVYTYLNNYGKYTLETVQSATATYSLYRYSDILKSIKIYSPGIAVTKTISEKSGYASFSSANKVRIPADVTVFKAALNTEGDKVVLTAVSDGENPTVVPAYCGVILYKENGGAQEFAACTKFEQSNFSGNQLIASADANYTTVPTTGTFYALKANAAEFAQVKGGTTLSADKAYIAAASSAKTLSIVFDDETTGINNVNAAAAQQNNTYFNLQGMKVEKPSKGLYIVNGKKVIVK